MFAVEIKILSRNEYLTPAWQENPDRRRSGSRPG
jgi:hypothetical protein